jgi:site-specific recombinase XerD
VELQVIKEIGKEIVVLLDDDMKIVKPVYDYLKFQRQKDKALNTLKANGNDLRTYWQFLKENGYEYNKVTPNMIADFIDYLRRPDNGITSIHIESARTNRTINRILSTVHMFYQFCADMEEIDNPILMHDISRPQNMFKSILHHTRSDNQTKQSIFKVKESDYAVRLVTDDEMEVFLNHLTKRRDILMYKTLYLTGARIQEVLDLEIESVPIPDMSKPIGVFQQIKSKGKTRDLYVPMALIEQLDNFIFEERNLIDTENSYIFVSEQKRQLGKQLTYSAVYDHLKKVQDDIGIYFNFHDLRHTFCSNLIQSGMDISVARIIMGHEHISTTQKYTHLSNPYIEDSLTRYWSKSSLLGGASDEE